jgi:hypothetical protein
MLKPLLWKRAPCTKGEAACCVVLVALLILGLVAFALVAVRW